MSKSEKIHTPREIIERIRTTNFLLDMDGESEKIKEGAKNLQRQLNNALKLLSQDLYSKKSHFILELVQNADDNIYEADIIPHLTFLVKKQCLISINNEIGFNEENIQAICSVGASSKSKNKEGYIGEKGIGFKSVFTVSDAPEIHSNGFHFKFDRSDESNLLGYVVPYWCEPSAEAPLGHTTIILPAAKDYEFGINTLMDLDARLLLFLNKLRQFTLEQDNKRFTYSRTDEPGASRLTAACTTSAGENTLEEIRYVRSELAFLVNEQWADEKRPGVERSTVVLAFPVDESGAAKPEADSNIFAFLPIRQMGFKFSIQADFILSSSREEILTDRTWNVVLRNCISVIFLHAVESFKKTNELKFTYLEYLPAEGDIIDPFFRIVRKQTIDLLVKSECLLSSSGAWKIPNELRIADNNFRTLFPSDTALELFDFDYVDLRVQGGDALLRTLGVTDVLTQDVLSIFKFHGTWLQNQSLDWRGRFYAYIADIQQKLINTGLLQCPCLPTSTGALVIPSNINVFFPLNGGHSYGFEDEEMTFVDNLLYEEALKNSTNTIKLFIQMGVKRDEPYDMVNSHILPRHKDDKWTTCSDKAIIGHLRYIKDKADDYIKSAAAHGKNEVQAFQILRDGIWIGTKQQQLDGNWQFALIGELYLSKEYNPNYCIETLLNDALDLSSLVSSSYLTSEVSEIESWRQFFVKLGVRMSPVLESDGLDWECSNELELLLGSTQAAIRRETLEWLNQYWPKYTGFLTYAVPNGRSSIIKKDTKFVISLRATGVPNKKRTNVALSESYYPNIDVKNLLGESLPYIDAKISEPMLDACCITYKLDAKALVKRLKQLKTEGNDTSKQLQGIYRALDGHLWDTDAAFIRQSFLADGLIRTKGAHKAWSKPSDVSWKSNGQFIDSLFPALQGQYRDYSRFFNERLSIPRELPTSKWVEALASLAYLESVEERTIEALSIYRRANRDLTPRFGREVARPDWLDIFDSKAVYINQRGEMVANDEYLFANDAPELAKLFENDEGISFLAIPTSDVPRLNRLLDAVNVNRLTASIDVLVINFDTGNINSELTKKIRSSVHFCARVLYTKYPEIFLNAIDSECFYKLKEFNVVEVKQVNLLVSLYEYSHETTTDMAISGNSILYRIGSKSVTDKIASELCKFLQVSVDLADTFARIIMTDDTDSIEDFLNLRNIGSLPVDLLESLNNSLKRKPKKDESDELLPPDLDDVKFDNDELIEAWINDDNENIDADSNSEKNNTLVSKVHVSHPTPRHRKDSDKEVANTSTNIVDGAADSSATKTPAPSPSPTHKSAHAAADDDVQPEDNEAFIADVSQKFQESPTHQPHSFEHGSGSPLDFQTKKSEHDQASQMPAKDTSARTSGTAPSWTSPEKTSFKRKPKRGSSSPIRTKEGRLMSYASGPDDTNRANVDEDPSRAAAREAVGQAAVEHFLTTQSSRWKTLVEMPHNNPGFDIHAVTHDGIEEYIEVKGQGGAWTGDGVALTPTELMTASQKRERYWLCVVEYAQDNRRRQLYLLRNPYGHTQQFRFDSGWKTAAETFGSVSLQPEKNLYIDMKGIGQGQILSAKGKGTFFKLHVMLTDGRQVNRPFNPATMKLAKEPMWQE